MANLLVVSGYWPCRNNPISGIFVIEQIRAFTELGHKVWVIVAQAVGRGRDLMSLEDLGLNPKSVTLISPRWIRFPERVSHLPVVFRRNTQNMGACVIHTVRHIQESGVDFDGALAHDLRYAISSASIWGPRLDRPIMGLVHGVDPLLGRKALDTSVVDLLHSGVQQLKTAGIVGSFLRTHLTDIGLDSNRFRLVPNGTEIPPDTGTPRCPSTGGKKRILGVGRLIELKGHDDTLRALAQLTHEEGLTDWHFRIVGDGEQRRQLQVLAADLGIAGKVEFAGRLDRAQTLAAFDECDIFCLPSWAEAFGIVFLEAMARGRPVIGCNNCGPADFLTNDRDGILVPPKAPAMLSFALRALWEEPERLSAIGAAGRKTAEKLTWQRNARQIIEMLGLS